MIDSRRCKFYGLNLSDRKRPKITIDSRKILFQLEDVLELVQEPFIDVRHLPYFVDAITTMEGS